MLIVLQLEQPEPLTWTETSLTFVAPQVLLLLLPMSAERLKLQEYAPTCNTLIDPPYKFPPLVVVKALESTEVVFRTRTLMPLTLVDPHVLLDKPKELRLQEYAPMWKENDPPYTFAPIDEDSFGSLNALHDLKSTVSSMTFTLQTTVSPTSAAAAPVEEYADEYAPMCNDTAPPYAFPPRALALTEQFANVLLCSAMLRNETLRSCSPADTP